MIEQDVYRCGEPNELNLKLLDKLKLKTIVWLAPEEYVQERTLDFHHFTSESVNAWETTVTDEVVVKSLELILNVAAHPILIMCHLGRHRTGCIVGILRKLQQWNLASIFEEYRRYSESKIRITNEQFIELFDTELIKMPTNPPFWL